MNLVPFSNTVCDEYGCATVEPMIQDTPNEGLLVAEERTPVKDKLIVLFIRRFYIQRCVIAGSESMLHLMHRPYHQ